MAISAACAAIAPASAMATLSGATCTTTMSTLATKPTVKACCVSIGSRALPPKRSAPNAVIAQAMMAAANRQHGAMRKAPSGGWPHHTAESDMARRSVDRMGVARGGAVTPAIARRAQMRAALQHLARDAAGIARIDAGHARILERAAMVRALRRCGPPVGRPLPDVADHVVEAVAVRRERAHRRGARPAVEREILEREAALPDIGERLVARLQLVAPGVGRAREAAARGVLPFGFIRQFGARPTGIGFDVAPSHVHHGMIEKLVERALRSIRMAPVGAVHVAPPLRHVAQIDRPA